MPKVTILIPTYNRPCALAATLTSLCFQAFEDFNLVISDQSDMSVLENDAVLSVKRILEHHGNVVKVMHHLPRRGMAEQRQFLLHQANSSFSLFLDDDIILEPWVIKNLVKAIEEERCGFVGMGIIGLGYKDIPESLILEPFQFWEGKVQPERVAPNTPAWERRGLHTGANPYHLSVKHNLKPEQWKAYKIAWVGACTLYDTGKLKEVGGFSFWPKLPSEHAGEDVLVQLRMMEKFGGCAILPSGAYHQEQPTSIMNREVDAPKYLEI